MPRLGLIFRDLGIRFCILGISLLLFPKPLGGRDLLSWYLLQILVFIISAGPAMWLETIILTKKVKFDSILLFLNTIWKTKKGILIIIAIIVNGFITIRWTLLYGDLALPKYELHIIILIYLAAFLLFFQPPLVIVLTGSENNQLIELISRSLFPHRALALLDEKKLGWTMFFGGQTDNLRALPLADWKKIVRNLVDETPIIIVDTRIARESSIYETGLVLEKPERISKAIFVISPKGEKPALESHREKIEGNNLLLVPDESLPKLLIYILKTGYTRITKQLRINNQQQSEPASSIMARKINIIGYVWMLGHQDDKVYNEAIATLTTIGEPAIPELSRVLSDKWDDWLRRKNAAVTLGRMKCNFDSSILISALRDADRNVQQGAAWAIGNLRIKNAVSPLTDLIFDVKSSWYSKLFAVHALGNIGTLEARVTLSSFDNRIEELLEALQIGGKPSELQTLYSYLLHRHTAMGGNNLDYDSMRDMMKFALNQFQDDLQQAVTKTNNNNS